MKKQEIRILTMIIRELSLVMLMHNHDKFSVTLEKGSKETRFILKTDPLEKDLLERMKEKVNREREIEVETYGWELVGDVDKQSEFEILGLLIDYMEIEETAGEMVLTFVRKSMYRE